MAVAIALLWLLSGPIFHFSDTWQLVINTGTTIVTFLMVFVIQHTQNRETTSMQLKRDELVRATRRARNSYLDVEDFPDEDLERLQRHYVDLAQQARAARRHGQSPRSVPRDRSQPIDAG